jgi:hypothetical protein
LKSLFNNVQNQVLVPHAGSKNLFWLIDFLVNDGVYVQFDGVYWHGLAQSRDELVEAKKFGEGAERKIAQMQLNARKRDKCQETWFTNRDLNLVRIDEITASKISDTELKDLIKNCNGVHLTYQRK